MDIRWSKRLSCSVWIYYYVLAALCVCSSGWSHWCVERLKLMYRKVLKWICEDS